MSVALPAFAVELLRESRVARLGTADRAGQPLVVPVCYVFDGRACFSAIDAKPKRIQAGRLRRLRNIAENPRVSLVVDRYDEEWTRLCWVERRTRRRSASPFFNRPRKPTRTGRDDLPRCNSPPIRRNAVMVYEVKAIPVPATALAVPYR